MVMAVVGGIIMLVALYLVVTHAPGFQTVVGTTGQQITALVKQLQGN